MNDVEEGREKRQRQRGACGGSERIDGWDGRGSARRRFGVICIHRGTARQPVATPGLGWSIKGVAASAECAWLVQSARARMGDRRGCGSSSVDGGGTAMDSQHLPLSTQPRCDVGVSALKEDLRSAVHVRGRCLCGGHCRRGERTGRPRATQPPTPQTHWRNGLAGHASSSAPPRHQGRRGPPPLQRCAPSQRRACCPGATRVREGRPWSGQVPRRTRP